MSRPKVTRRQFLRTGIGVTGATLLGLGGYSYLIEPHRPVVERVVIRLERLPETFDGFKIAQLSDIHFGPHLGEPEMREIVEMTNSLDPDLIVLTGDFITVPWLGNRSHALKYVEPCAVALAGLRGKAGKIAVLGNHDQIAKSWLITDALQSHGTTVLRNRAIQVEADRSRVWVAGLEDVLSGNPNLEKTLRTIPPGETTILLVHEPDYADNTALFPVDLQLSGHSHGGQVRIPLMGAPILPRLARKYPQGLRRIGRLQLYTTRGIGVIDPPIRLNCPPEVTLVTLQSPS